MPAAHLLGPDVAALPEERPRHYRGCSGKRPLSRAGALAVVSRRGGAGYLCRWCGAWHTTSTLRAGPPEDSSASG